jgi:hypothetical protein
MNEHLIRNYLFDASLTTPRIWLNVLGMIPLYSSTVSFPTIECVFPHPVCPYAKIVPL